MLDVICTDIRSKGMRDLVAEEFQFDVTLKIREMGPGSIDDLFQLTITVDSEAEVNAVLHQAYAKCILMLRELQGRLEDLQGHIST